jgi:hypothetical protein
MAYLIKAKTYRFASLIPRSALDNGEDNYLFKDFINNLNDTSDNRELISKMRSAWRQERYRQGNKEKSKGQYSFVLSSQTNDMLDFLSKEFNHSRNKTLEMLISKQYNSVVRKKKKELKRK